MEITIRGFWTLVHGMGFGALYLLACSGTLVELWRRYAPGDLRPIEEKDETFLRVWLIAMAVLAWLTVLSGTYVIYPWYRAVPPVGTVNLGEYPRQLLISSPATRGWHAICMEWKEHIAWLVPICTTMAASVFSHYRRNLKNKPALRGAVLAFTLVALFAAGVAGFAGAMINKHAPVEGGEAIQMFAGAR